jgi:baseplate J-like protein
VSAPPPPLVPRDSAAVVRDLRVAASRTALPVPSGTGPAWAAVLFAADDWADGAEPSQALLQAFAELHAALGEHLATVPPRVQAAWLRDRLGIAPLEGVADSVVVAATVDPARTPVAIAAATPVRAKDSAKRERRYTTTETLNAHGIELIDVLSHGAEVLQDGSVADTAGRWTDRDAPFSAFAGQPPAAHRFFVISDVLAFASGTMNVRLTFSGPVDARALDAAEWEFPVPDGVGRATRLASTAASVDLQLAGGCTPAAVLGTTAPYLCASLPEGARTPAALGFAPLGVTVKVIDRRDVAVDGAFANDGKLDPTKELQPFGPTPHRGDAFYVRSDEAFGKPLDSLKVVLSLLDSGSGGLSGVPWSPLPTYAISGATQHHEAARAGFATEVNQFIDDIIGYFEVSAEPTVDWQAHDGHSWTTLGSTGDELKTFSWAGTTAAGAPRSFPIDLGGEGNFLRAFLAEGDFGWAAYQAGIADFAAEAAKDHGNPDASLLIPPDPPILSSVRVEYTTMAVTPAAMASVDGWTTRHPPASGPYPLYGMPFELGGASAGMIALGLRLGEAALGTAVSLYIEVESAPACGSPADTPLRWEYWSAAGTWAPLGVADGTLGLRQPGLLRFVAPLDWAEGSDGASAAEGRWIRAVTPDNATVGAILSIVPDAVEVTQDAAVVGGRDALAPGQVKGLLTTPAGLKKLTNPIAGRPGRDPEDSESAAYLSRAAGAVRHRWRALTAWDCEELIRTASPDVAAVRCLPHTGLDGETAPGWIGAVVVPSTGERLPLPGISLAEKIRIALAPALAAHAQLAILCPLYVPITVTADIVLAPGVAAIDARTEITAALELLLHPTGSDPVRFGLELFASSIAAWLEARTDIDHLDGFALLTAGVPVERVTVDPCRGVVASAGDHALALQEQL